MDKMKINRLELINFSSYYGKHQFNFNQKFNLIGGENGAGKSSILRALIWSLFGHRMFDSNFPTNKYKEFVKSSLNQNATDFFSVTVDLEIDNIQYRVMRKINFEASKEECKFYKEGIEVNDIEQLNNYSPNMIEAYFFDGEKVLNNIVDNDLLNFVNNLVTVAFNLDTFNQISQDLQSLKRRQIKQYSNHEYQKLVIKYERVATQKKQSDQDIIKLENKIDETNLKINMLENRMKEKNVLSNIEMEKLTQEHDSIKNEIYRRTKNIKSFTIHKLDKVLLYPLLESVLKDLSSTKEERLKIIKSFYDSPNMSNFNLENYVDLKLEQSLFNLQIADKEFDYQKMKLQIVEKISLQKKELKIRELMHESAEGKSYIAEIDNYETLVANLNDYSIELKNEQANNIKVEQKLNELIIEKETAEKLITNELQAENAMNEAEKLQAIINEYKEEQSKIIYNDLSVVVSKVYRKIARKKGVVSSVKITPEKIELITKENNLNIQSLSSGEKQVLVVALIIGVIKLAQNDIPLILDTFFGRLDVAHTKKLIEFLRDEIDNQIIFLTTNKEITKQEYSFLKNINKSEYLLINNNGKTKVRKGFFTYEN